MDEIGEAYRNLRWLFLRNMRVHWLRVDPVSKTVVDTVENFDTIIDLSRIHTSKFGNRELNFFTIRSFDRWKLHELKS